MMFDVVNTFFDAVRALDIQGRTAGGAGGAIWDELMHAATASIFLLAVVPWLKHERTCTKPFIIATFSGSVLIDVDHVPGWLGFTFLQSSTGRPHTHSLTTILVVMALATLVSHRYRVILLGVAFGITAHLFRDMSTGGVSIWWPVDLRRVTCPYDYYLFILTGMVGLGVIHMSGIAGLRSR